MFQLNFKYLLIFFLTTTITFTYVTSISNNNNTVPEYITVLFNSEEGTQTGYIGTIDILPGNEDKPLAIFKGIPYAQPPIGDFRYKPPVSYEEKEIRNATTFPPPCLQWDLFRNKNVTGSEDCLQLNIYKPNNTNIQDKLYPVMVFFHGVGFIAGQSDTYNPEYLVYKDVIVLTVQYRLGALGFLSTGDKLQPGNMGLLDQVEALHWIQKYIHHFNGDPDKVTIFGESAGAVSVTLHLLSPLTKGLFRAAIIQSGTAIAPYAIQRNPMIHVQRLAASLGCISGNTSMLLDCIKYSDPKEVVASDALVLASGNNIGRKSSRSYKKPPNPGPVIQHELVDNWPTFLSEDPIIILKEGRFHQVPVVIGINRDESASAVINNLFPKLMNATLNDPTYPERSFLKKIIKSSGIKNNTDIIKLAIKFEYFKDYNMSDILELKDEYISLHSDFSVVGPVYTTALYLSQYTKVYFYTFEYEGDLSFSQILTQTPDNEPQEKRKRRINRDLLVDGNTFNITPELAAELDQISQEIYNIDDTRYVIHGEELLYVFRFRNPSNGVMIDIEDEEGKKVRQTITTFWTNMAKYSSPSEILSPEIITWKTFTQDGPYTLKMTEKPALLISYRHRKMLFWTYQIQQLEKLQICS